VRGPSPLSLDVPSLVCVRRRTGVREYPRKIYLKCYFVNVGSLARFEARKVVMLRSGGPGPLDKIAMCTGLCSGGSQYCDWGHKVALSYRDTRTKFYRLFFGPITKIGLYEDFLLYISSEKFEFI